MGKREVQWVAADGSVTRCRIEAEATCCYCGRLWSAMTRIDSGIPMLVHQGEPCPEFVSMPINDYLAAQTEALKVRPS